MSILRVRRLFSGTDGLSPRIIANIPAFYMPLGGDDGGEDAGGVPVCHAKIFMALYARLTH